MTSRRTIFLASFGSSICSQMATLKPLRISLADVALGGVIGHAAHGNGDALFLIARGQRDLQFARRDDGVLEEEFVEVTQAERRAARWDGPS